MTKHRLFKISIALFIFVAALSLRSNTFAANDDVLKQKLDNIAGAIQSYLNQVDSMMTSTAKSLSNVELSGPKAHSILANLCGSWPKPTIECMTITASGIIAAVEPAEYQRFQGGDYSKRPQISAALATKKPFISHVFKPHDELNTLFAISYFWPISSQKGAFAGLLGVIVKPLDWLDSLILPQLGSNAYNVWILDTDGTFMYSRYHKEIGEDLLVVPDEASGSSLGNLIGQITSNQSGSAYLTLPPTGKAQPMVQRCIWKTISLRGLDRRVVILGTRETN